MENKNKILVALGQRIASERKRRGITLEKLAYEMENSKGNLSDIEHAKKDPRYTTLITIADGLEISVSKSLKEPIEK